MFQNVSYHSILSLTNFLTNMTRKTQSSSSRRGKSRASGAVHASKVSSSRRSGVLHRSTLTAQDISADRQHVAARYQAEMSGMILALLLTP
jgi:hypothetical protein